MLKAAKAPLLCSRHMIELHMGKEYIFHYDTIYMIRQHPGDSSGIRFHPLRRYVLGERGIFKFRFFGDI